MNKNILTVIVGTGLMIGMLIILAVYGRNIGTNGKFTRTAIELENEVKSVGPYSQVMRAGDFLYCTAQVAFDPDTDELIKGGITEQVDQIFLNFEAELNEAGVSLDDVVKVTVYLVDVNDFEAMNKAYQKHFSEPYPARTCVAVSAIPVEGALLSVDLVAFAPQE